MLWRGLPVEPFWVGKNAFGEHIKKFITKTTVNDKIYLCFPIAWENDPYILKGVEEALQNGVEIFFITVATGIESYDGVILKVYERFKRIGKELAHLYLRRNMVGRSREMFEIGDDSLHSKFFLIFNKKDPIGFINSNIISYAGYHDNDELCVPIVDFHSCKKLLDYWIWLSKSENCRSVFEGWVEEYGGKRFYGPFCDPSKDLFIYFLILVKNVKGLTSFKSGVSEKIVLELFNKFGTINKIAKCDVKDLIKIDGIGEKKAKAIIEEAKRMIKKGLKNSLIEFQSKARRQFIRNEVLSRMRG
jgi:hypothetical protein